ncbi:MAG: MotA/TolQ/ExbB proton channel family protein [Planctomycetaceae bacterium]|nr:MotA/TolQ/ExbB proton channel family protein [Planctomycetaceae bacterium]
MLTQLFLRLSFLGAEWVLWLLVALSLLSGTLVYEKVKFFRRNPSGDDEFATQLYARLVAGDLPRARALISESRCIERDIIAAGLEALPRGINACGEAMLAAKAKLRPRLDAHLALLATIGSNAPFVGLLGTVLGVIKAAHDLGGKGDPAAVMTGVFEALVATAVGLAVAIPAVVMFNVFQRRTRQTLARLDMTVHLVLAGIQSEPIGTINTPAPGKARRTS